MSFWKEKRVLVTGATGLVGTGLVKKLVKEGAFVVGHIRDFNPQSELLRSKTIESISVVNGALEDFSSLERAINENEIDTVYHLAAQPIVGVANRNPLPTFESNIRGSYHLLEACRIHASLVKRVIVASSDKAYGEGTGLTYQEGMNLKAAHPYDVSKACTDLLAHTYFRTYQLPVAVARCGNIYGEGDLNWSRIIPGTIRSLLKKEQPLVRSDGKFTRDYIYLEDVVSAYLLLGESVEKEGIQGEAFNFGPSRAHSVLEIVDFVKKMMGSDLEPIILNEAKAEIMHQHLSAEKAQSQLNWQQKFSLEEGLSKTIEWYRSFLEVSHD